MAEALRKVRGRILVNQWLQQWVVCCNWIFAVLILLAALVRFLWTPLLAGGMAIAVAAGLAFLHAWYFRPSNYETAQRLDIEGHQQDRIATAVYFWEAANPSAMLLHQREDAVSRAAKLEPQGLFPVRMPAKLQWTAGLVLAFAALCAYHVNYGPPLPALKQKIVQSRTLAALLAPISRMLEGVTAEQAKATDSRDSGRSEASEAEKLLGSQPSTNSAQSTAFASNTPNGTRSDASSAEAAFSPNGESRQAGQNSNTAGKSGGQTTSGESDGKSENAAENTSGQNGTSSTSQNKQPSLAQRAFQALQSLMEGAFGKASSKATASAQPSEEAKSSQTNGLPAEGQATAATSQGSKGPSENGEGFDVSATANHNKISGAGNATPPWQPQANQEPLATKLTPEHVPLQSNGFKGPPGKERANVEAGTAQVPLQDVAPPAVATINGAGQDTVPSRYRQYVRDYFQQGKK